MHDRATGVESSGSVEEHDREEGKGAEEESEEGDLDAWEVAAEVFLEAIVGYADNQAGDEPDYAEEVVFI